MIPLGKYRHYKGGTYELRSIAVHSETLEEYAVYEALASTHNYPKGTIFVRPLKMFIEKIKINGTETPRFTFIESGTN